VVSEAMFFREMIQNPRGLAEILLEIETLVEKIWYNRHQNRVFGVAEGTITIIEKATPDTNHQNTILRHIWKGALKSAKRVERKYGTKNLIWDDFAWGMLNGKLSALRWALGEDWDDLDT
jgi:hypothetical protein